MLRVLVMCVAIVTCAWFVLGFRQAQEVADATAIVSQPAPITQAQAQHAASLLGSADTLYPGTDVALLRGRIAFARGNDALARTLLMVAIRKEPKNVAGWLWFTRASSHDPVAFYKAEIAIRRLLPHVPQPH